VRYDRAGFRHPFVIDAPLIPPSLEFLRRHLSNNLPTLDGCLVTRYMGDTTDSGVLTCPLFTKGINAIVRSGLSAPVITLSPPWKSWSRNVGCVRVIRDLAKPYAHVQDPRAQHDGTLSPVPSSPARR